MKVKVEVEVEEEEEKRGDSLIFMKEGGKREEKRGRGIVRRKKERSMNN